MKRILILSLISLMTLSASAQVWNACNTSVTVTPAPAYDSTFVLAAPSRAAIHKSMGTWVPASASSASYLVYTALLTQTGTDAPVATVLENTLGGTVVWSYGGAGSFVATLSGVFTSNKTWTTPSFITHSNGSPFTLSRASDNTCEITFEDDGLSGFPIEIRVYQP
jgi:hypothetical protein